MKKIQFKKILIFTVISVMLISSVSVVCFAEVGSGFLSTGDVLVFNDTLDISITSTETFYVDFHVIDSTGSPIYFSAISFTYPGRPVLNFWYSTGGYIEAYDDEWIDSFYQTIYIDSDVLLDSYWNAFLSLNTSSPVSNYYSQIYDIIMSSIYGDVPITSDMTLSASLVSTLLSMLVVLAPVLVGGFIFVWILKRF